MNSTENQTKKELIKSTSIVGGAQIATIIIGIVRTKIVAVLLGPSGLGILGMLQSIVDMTRNASGFGINFSSVKDIAEAVGTQDQERIAKTTTILRRWALFTGLLGTIIMMTLCYPLSILSFDSSNYTLSIAIVSVSLLFLSISSAQTALLQGLRRIGQMAKSSLFGAVAGTVIVLPIYWWLGEDGIAIAMVLSALGTLGITFIYARKANIKSIKLSWKETFKGGLGMAKLGFFIVVSGLIGVGTLYLVRIIIIDKMGLEGVGYMQSVWMISNVYIGIILNSMLADFFPRLSAVNTDNKEITKLVNIQLELALLSGAIMIALMISFASLALNILYSSKFDSAVPLLQWQMLGSIATFVAWPIGIIFLSKSKGHISVITDSIWCVLYVSMVYFGWEYFGFIILGIAFIIASVIKAILIYFIVGRIAQFRFTSINIKYIILFTIILTVIFTLNYCFDSIYTSIAGVVLTLGLVGYCLLEINKIINLANIIIQALSKIGIKV